MGLHSVEGILTYFQKEDGKTTYNATVENITKKDGTALSGKEYHRRAELHQDCKGLLLSEESEG